MQVEVCVQDCYCESSQLENSHLKLSNPYQGKSPLDTDRPITAANWETWFRRWLETLQHNIQLAEIYELTLRLTDDDEIQVLNAQYRHQNKPTDVLAFAALEVDCPQPDQMSSSLPLYLGDIIISVDTAARQAQQHEHSLQFELAWLAAHGLLHLLGWDHPDEVSLKRMLDQQTIMLQTVGIAINESVNS